MNEFLMLILSLWLSILQAKRKADKCSMSRNSLSRANQSLMAAAAGGSQRRRHHIANRLCGSNNNRGKC